MKYLHCGLLLALIASPACRQADHAAALEEVQRVHAGALDVVLLSASGTLQQGKGAFVLEFRATDGQLVDVGMVNVNATMAMAGMAPMFGASVVAPTAAKGRYEVTSELSMAGTWRFDVAWNGPAGRGSTSLAGAAI